MTSQLEPVPLPEPGVFPITTDMVSTTSTVCPNTLESFFVADFFPAGIWEVLSHVKRVVFRKGLLEDNWTRLARVIPFGPKPAEKVRNHREEEDRDGGPIAIR